jgi:protein associated with RNAse G/E
MIPNPVIKSFKHDGTSHRLWMYLTLLKEDDDFVWLGGEKAKVIEHDGREWRAQEGALYILSKKHFYNAIVMFKNTKDIVYYINIASPTIKDKDGNYLFIDYDLDLKKEADGRIKEIDLGEYAHNSQIYSYSEKLRFVLEKTFLEAEELLASQTLPFNDEENRKMYASYLSKLH